MKSKLFNEIKYKFSSDNFSKQKTKIENTIENVIDENSHYNEALRIDSLTNANSQNLVHILGAIIYNSTACLGTCPYKYNAGLYEYSDKLSWKKICDIASSYRDILAPAGKKLNTSYKAAVLMALIIQSNIIDNDDDKIRLALDSALFYMCNYAVEYNGKIPVVQRRIAYNYNIPDIEKILKYIKVYQKNKSDSFRENGGGPIYEIPMSLASEFEPLIIYIHKYLILQYENENIIFNVYQGANEYDEMFKEDETKETSGEVNEVKSSNRGIARIFRRKK